MLRLGHAVKELNEAKEEILSHHGMNTLASVKPQLRWIALLLVRELEPLREAEQYWMNRIRKRFSLLSVMFYDSKRGSDELREIRREISRGRNYVGQCEMVLRNLQSEPSNESLCKALDFVDRLLLLPSDSLERIEFLQAQKPGKSSIVVDANLVEHIQTSIPFYDRSKLLQTVATTGVGIASLVLLARPLFSLGNGPSRSISLPVESGKWWMMEHILKPSRGILEQMFFHKAQQDAIRNENAAAVSDASQSLKNMITNYRNRSKLTDTEDFLVISGDYEKEVSKPLYSAFFGNLIELMLIQIQFMKKEGLETIHTLDRLLEENRLNTQLAVLGPALLVVGALYSGMRSIYYTLVDDTHSRHRSRKHIGAMLYSLSSSLQDLEAGDLPMDTNFELEGKITQEIFSLANTLDNYSGTLLSDEILENLLGRHGQTGRQILVNQIAISMIAL